MKKLSSTVLLLLGLVPLALAGPSEVSSSKEYKQPAAPPVAETCFKERELQIDQFGEYSAGKSGHVGMFREHGWGGGIGLNYFFSRNIGLGVDASWLDIKEDTTFQEDRSARAENTTLHNVTSSVIFRFPIDSACLAPYAYVGGGFHVDGEQWASAHAGVGIEYRIRPGRFGIFADGRWTYLGDRKEHDDLNYFTARTGIRLVF